MGKQLIVTVRAQDQISPVMRRIVADTLRIGQTAVAVTARVTRALAGPLRALTSVRGIMLTTLGALGTGRVLASFNEAARLLDEMAKASQRLGIGVEQLSSLKHTADLANVSFEQLLGGLETASKNLGQFAATGGGRASEAIKLLGVRVRDAGGGVRALADMLPELADAVNAIPDSERRLFFVQKVFGDPAWVNLLAEGGARLRAFSEEARRLNAVFTPEQARIAEEYRDAIARVQTAWLALRVNLLTQVGPVLTDLLNRLSSFIAAAPAMVRRLMETIRNAFGGGPEGERAREALAEMFDSWGEVAVAGVKGIGLVVGAAATAVISALADDWSTRAKTEGKNIAFAWGSGLEEGIKQRLTVWAVGRRVIPLFESMERIRDQAGTFLGSETRSDFKPESMLEGITERLNSLRPALVEARRLIGDAGGEAFAATDRVVGILDALAETTLPALDARMDQHTAAVERAASAWSRFEAGLGDAFHELVEEAKDLQGLAREAMQSFLQTGVNNLTTALVDAAAGVKSLKDAFRDFTQSALRQVAELTTRILIMRAIAGAFGGGAASATGGGASFGTGVWAPTGLRLGGLVRRPMAAAAMLAAAGFAGGGFVHGPNVDRDIVPARLAPGEFVLRRRAVEAIGVPALQRMNRDGGGGAGVTIIVNQTNHFSGGSASSAATVARAAGEAVVRALDQHPTIREAMRRRLA